MTQVHLEQSLFEHSINDLAQGTHSVRWNKAPESRIRPSFVPVEINPSATRSGVGGEAYDAYRLGLAGACADIVLVRGGPNPISVPMIYRKRPPFGKTWWIMGGAVHNFRSIHHFLLFKALTEGGIVQVPVEFQKDGSKAAQWFYDKYPLGDNDWSLQGVNVVGLMGCYRTPAEDQAGTGKVCDTLNLCYLGVLDPGVEVWHDRDHEEVRWFDMDQLTYSNMHWYPKRVATHALLAYKSSL